MTKEQATREALRMALEALRNVPVVGEVYDQQHSDTHLRAILLAEVILAQPEQCTYPKCDYPCMNLPDCKEPEQRKPLTEWQMCNIAEQCGCMSADWIDFARAIEAAHGIKE